MKYTFKDITSSLTKKKNSRSSFWVQLWVRKASFPVTYLFINAGWSANMVSVLSWVVVFAAAALLCIPNFWCMLAGVILTNFWLVLDCVDGKIPSFDELKPVAQNVGRVLGVYRDQSPPEKEGVLL